MLSWAHSCHRCTHNPFIANPIGWLVFFVGFGGVCLLVEIIAIVQKKPANWDFLIASAVMFAVGLLAYMNKVSADPFMPSKAVATQFTHFQLS